MIQSFRKLSLMAHVVCSVGWIGALAGFLALSIAGVASYDPERIRASYVSMELLGRFVLVPLSFSALATGIFLSLSTEWGLVRHYWVLAKLVLTVIATFLLLLHQFTAVTAAASAASASGPRPHPELGDLGTQLVANAVGGILILIAVTALSIYKPWGPTRFGLRSSQSQAVSVGVPLPKGLKVALIIVALVGIAFAVIHLLGGGMGHRHHVAR